MLKLNPETGEREYYQPDSEIAEIIAYRKAMLAFYLTVEPTQAEIAEALLKPPLKKNQRLHGSERGGPRDLDSFCARAKLLFKESVDPGYLARAEIEKQLKFRHGRDWTSAAGEHRIYFNLLQLLDENGENGLCATFYYVSKTASWRHGGTLGYPAGSIVSAEIASAICKKLKL